VGERSGYVLSDEFLAAADALRAETGIPLVFVESAGALGRNGKSLFVTDSIDVTPNMVLWYTGVQLGQIFVDDHYYVPKPLTLISTWDGDEVCMRRTLCHLREAQSFLGKGVAAAFMTELHTIAKNVKLNGSGLWQVLDFGDETKAEKFLRNCYAQGLRLGRGLPGRVVIAPSLTMDETEMKQGLKIIAQAL
jgi:RHH-type proline utilization regulon transcriptional repressor/proline dehydrogenase/delta 1-pyrroline-5-carboxylate dehydrogenase